MQILMVEDGFEYTETYSRYLGEGFEVVRAGCGSEAIGLISTRTFDLLFLDMRFDRVTSGQLLGDLADTAERFNGDPVRARQFLEENQGVYILAALRAAACVLPALFSHDFSGEPKRWAALERKYAPVRWLPDNASPAQVRALLREAAHG